MDLTPRGALKAAADELIASDAGLATLKQSIAARRSKLVGEMGRTDH